MPALKAVAVFIAVAVLMLTLATCIANAEGKNSNFTIITGTTSQLNTALAASDPEKLKIAAKTGESHIVNITSEVTSKLIFAQERVALSLDCLPLLQRIGRNQNGKLAIQWFFQQLSETGAPTSNRTQLTTTLPDRLSFQRILVGGESDHWLNITQTVAVPGAEDPDNKLFICRILTPDDGVYYESTLNLQMVGAPPVIIRGNGSAPVEEHGQTKFYHIGAEICISRNSPVIISLACEIAYGPPLPYPNPNRTWTKDESIVHTTEHGENPDITSFLSTHISMMPGSLDPTPLTVKKDGSIVLSTQVRRISSPTLFKEGYSLDDARDDVFKSVLGTWTCGVNNSYGTDVVTTVIIDCDTEDLSPPYEVQGYCSHINWRNSPNVSCEDISGYDVRLFNPNSGLDVTRRVGVHGTFYSLLAIDKALKNDSTTFQVRVVSSSLSRVGPYSSAAKLGCPEPEEQPTTEPVKVYFELNGKTFVNNSVASFLEIGEGDSALICKTNKVECCGTRPNRYGEFYYPNRARVPIISRAGGAELYRDRGNQLIRLNRRSGIVSPLGKYRCEIPDDDDIMQKIFITLN